MDWGSGRRRSQRVAMKLLPLPMLLAAVSCGGRQSDLSTTSPAAPKRIEPRATLRGHRLAVYDAAFSPADDLLASAGSDRLLELWDVGTGRSCELFEAHKDRIWSVAFSADGRLLASGGGLMDGTAKVWRVDQGHLRMLYALPVTQKKRHSEVTGLAFSPDGRLLATGGSDRVLRLWNMGDGSLAKEFEGHTDLILRTRYAPEGSLIATCGFEPVIYLWDARVGSLKRMLRGHTDTVWRIEFLPDSRTLVSTSADGSVRLWEVASGECRAVLKRHRESVQYLSLCGRGELMATGDDAGDVLLWAVGQNRVKHRFRGYPAALPMYHKSSGRARVRTRARARRQRRAGPWACQGAGPAGFHARVTIRASVDQALFRLSSPARAGLMNHG